MYREVQKVAEKIASIKPSAIRLDPTGHAAVLIGADRQYLFAWNLEDRVVALKFLNSHYRPASAQQTLSESAVGAPTCRDQNGDPLITMPPQSLVGIPLDPVQ